MRETDISNIAIDAAKVGGVNAKNIARYEKITSGMNMNEHCDNPRFCGLGSWEQVTVSEGAPVSQAGLLLQTPLSGGYDYELYFSVTNRIFFRPLDLSSPTKKSEWKELATLSSLNDYVAKDELEALVKEIVSKNNEDMQVTENQALMGGV